MEMTDRNTESNHKDHHDPAFHIKKSKRTVLFPFLGNPLGMFNKQTAKDKLEEKQENNNCLSDFKQPVMGIVQPRDDADP